ncbi:MAG: SpoIID/LytB domain-containing protein [Planctomycetota bacterium]
MRIRSEATLRYTSEPGGTTAALATGTWHDITTRNGHILINQEDAGGPVNIEPVQDKTIELVLTTAGENNPARNYPGRFTMAVGPGGTIVVINYVDLETYVACVIAYELLPGFERESYRAGAIVARTFAVFQMRRRNRCRDNREKTRPWQRATRAALSAPGSTITNPGCFPRTTARRAEAYPSRRRSSGRPMTCHRCGVACHVTIAA